MTIGEKIKFYRNNLNLSQEQLANKCNLSRNAIYNYEKNKRTPTSLIKIKQIFIDKVFWEYNKDLASTPKSCNAP